MQMEKVINLNNNNLAVDLDEFYSDLIEGEIQQEVGGYDPVKYAERFTITSDAKADLYLEKVKCLDIRARKYEESVKAKVDFLQSKIDQLKKELAVELEDINNNKSFFEKLLSDYFESLPKESKKESKTMWKYKLASGEIIKKKATQSIKCLDKENVLLQYVIMNAHDEYIKTKQELDWQGLKNDLKIKDNVIVNEKTGEIIEDVEDIVIEESPEKFEIKFKL